MELKTVHSQKAGEYLESLSTVKWTVHGNLTIAPNMERRRLYGIQSSNIVESDNAKKKHPPRFCGSIFLTYLDIHNVVRYNLPFAALHFIMLDVMTTAAARADEVFAWEKAAQEEAELYAICSCRVCEQKEMSPNYNTAKAKTNDDEYQVTHTGVCHSNKRVRIDALSCTSSYRDQMQLPCRHLICFVASLTVFRCLMNDWHGRPIDSAPATNESRWQTQNEPYSIDT
ncbi:hypothetical protein ACHHYP_20565 [Achlya hypogyna]|uniref:SWIM-type domain-containing protein n=1 Tax=Achlya hypogyna TaxID=1202772 RepID=A0A1V9ZHG1_ACHHY|nr:hypothetical protein ACHHYP_20565 [Achlya hypogyna]